MIEEKTSQEDCETQAQEAAEAPASQEEVIFCLCNMECSAEVFQKEPLWIFPKRLFFCCKNRNPPAPSCIFVLKLYIITVYFMLGSVPYMGR